MKIFNFVKKDFHKKKLNENKNSDNSKNLKNDLQYDIKDEKIINTLTLEQMKIEQIKLTNFIVLFKEGHLSKEDIIRCIKDSYSNVVLSNEEMEALISIQKITQYEDLHGNYNIREFIDEDEENIIELVDGLVENARKEAKKYKSKDISAFVTTDYKVINEIKNKIREKNKNKEEEYK